MAPIVYSSRYHIDIGSHVFATSKYPRLHRFLIERRLVSAHDVVEPDPMPWEDLALVHTGDYLDKLRHGTMSPAEQAQMEIDASPRVVEGFRLMAGGTLLAARIALGQWASEPAGLRRIATDGGVASADCGAGPPALAAGFGSAHRAGEGPYWHTRALGLHLGGGFHHASEDHGEGFCVFNDVAVAIRVLQRDRAIGRAAIVDCDVHHGNGTAFIFAGDRSVFTFSIHQEHNYPFFKPHGSLDIHLPDYTDDEAYLRQLAGALPRVFASGPDIVFYLAGADPFEEDQLGGLSLTKEGLRRRDRLVLNAARELDVPVVVTLAGGYARRLEDTVDIHAATIEEGLHVFAA